MMPAAPARSLGEIRHVRKLAASRSIAEIRRKLRQLARGRRIAARRGACGGGLQVSGNLLSHLRILARVGLLKLLQRVHQLGERRELAIVRLPCGRSPAA